MIIGSGAGGGIMAKQLSVAGFSVVVLEQGGWGKYGREQEYNKDEWLNRNLSDDDRLMSDPSRQRNTFRRNDKTKAVPGTHSYGCVVGGGTVTYGSSSWRHLPYEFREASADPTIPSGTGMADWPITYEELEPLLHPGRMGDGHIRPAREFTVRRADVERLSGAARAAEEFGRAVQYRGG